MKLIKIISVISAIYFAVLLKVYTQSEGRRAAFMGIIITVMIFILSALYEESKESDSDSGGMR